MHRRTALAEAVRERLEAYFPGRVTPPLGINVAIDEAQSPGKTVWDYAPRSRRAGMTARASPPAAPAGAPALGAGGGAAPGPTRGPAGCQSRSPPAPSPGHPLGA